MTATSKLTKAQLIAKIDALEAEIDALHIEQRPSRRLPSAGVKRPQHAIPAHFAAARELAMRSGHSVKVG